MRFVLLSLILMPCAAQANDTRIDVEYTIVQERVSPSPAIVHPRIHQQIVLHEGGTIDNSTTVSGRFGTHFDRSDRLGSKRFKVSNTNTITRNTSEGGQHRRLTVTTHGTGCTATLDITGPSEHVAYSTGLNTKALYRNTRVESISCKIE
jgi:hypothetical protein